MKKITTLFTLALLTQFTIAQNAFEGKIIMHCENSLTGENSEINWTIKDGNHRMEYTNVAGNSTNSYVLQCTGNKAEMLSPKGNYEVAQEWLTKPDFVLTKYETIATSKEEINGFPCTKYSLKSADKSAEYWMINDPELKPSDFPEFMQNGLLSVSSKLAPGAIPIQIIIKDSNGKMLYTQTIKDIISVGK